MTIEKTNIESINCTSTYGVPTPEDLGTFLWLNSKDPSSVAIIDADSVTNWFDLSGNGRHVIKNFAPYPRYNVNQINGLPTINMNSSYFFNTSSALKLLGDVTIFAVGKFKTLSVNQCVLDHSGGPSEDEVFNTAYGMYTSTAGKLYSNHEYGNGANQIFAPNIQVDDPSDCSIMLRRDTTTKIQDYHFKNAFQDIQESQGYSFNPTGSNVADFRIGTSGVSVANYLFRGDLAEIFMFNRKLSDQEVIWMKAHINQGWGI